jgi:mannose-1-phosphate guanylyltransferase/phosphomannomutase
MGVVLAGTHPWTRSAFDRLPPRPLLPIAHRPLLSYSLSWLRDGGVSHAVVSANRETRVLESRLHCHVPDGLAVTYRKDTMPRGAAGALKDAIGGTDAQTYIVADGTSIPNIDLRDVLSAHRTAHATATIVSYTETAGHGKRAIQIPNGIYVFEREALAEVPERGFYDIKENLIPHLYRAKAVVESVVVATPTPRVLDAASYRAVNEWAVEQLAASQQLPQGYVTSGSCIHHRDASIACDVTFVGPVLVGPGARIESGAVIVGPTSIGRDVVVKAGAFVSRSAIWRRSVVEAWVVADGCIVADDARVPAGVQRFRDVLTASPELAETPSDLPPAKGEATSADVFRRMSAFFGRPVWSRFPAAP